METKQDQQKVIYTGTIPQCPHCKKPTKRTGGGGSTTLMYYQPVYNEKGENTNPDRNINTSSWNCFDCGKEYSVSGNHADGYYYKD